MSKRIWLAIFATVLLAAGIFLFTYGPGVPEAVGEIRVGAVLPLTGSAAQWGVPPRDAALLAVEEINARGGIKGKKIRLEIEDSRCEPAVGVSAAQKILVSGKPAVILGAVCSSVTLAMAPIAEAQKVVLVSPASTSPLITDAGDHVFRVVPTDALRGRLFAEYVYSLGHRRVSTLHINNEGGVGNQKAFAENFQRLGGDIISVDAYPQDARDVRAQLTKIKQQKPEAVLVVSYPDDTPLVLRQAQELKLGVPLFFQTEALDDPAVIQRAGNAAEGATYILPAKPEGPAVESFVQKYSEKYGRAPELFAAEGYDVIKLVARFLENSSDYSSDALKAGLYTTKGYQGASGTITFDENGDVIKPMAIKQIQQGKAATVESR
jgi:branched-chain amino acid transport system substrate-binding protein